MTCEPGTWCRGLIFVSLAFLSTPLPSQDGTSLSEDKDLAKNRMEVMAARAESIVITSDDPRVPRRLQSPPLFRYDDETRGYVDGTVWRLGEKGRPLAIITAELHPRYLGGGPRIVYDFLSLTDSRFAAKSADIPGWTPNGSAVQFQPLPNGPEPASESNRRFSQIKQQGRRFSGTQVVQETDETSVELRLLPQPIDRYSPGTHPKADGALFLLVNGRNPALLLLLETDGMSWRYAVGRLSSPSTLQLRLEGKVVWSQPRFTAFNWSEPYTASNSTCVVP